MFVYGKEKKLTETSNHYVVCKAHLPFGSRWQLQPPNRPTDHLPLLRTPPSISPLEKLLKPKTFAFVIAPILNDAELPIPDINSFISALITALRFSPVPPPRLPSTHSGSVTFPGKLRRRDAAARTLKTPRRAADLYHLYMIRFSLKYHIYINDTPSLLPSPDTTATRTLIQIMLHINQNFHAAKRNNFASAGTCKQHTHFKFCIN